MPRSGRLSRAKITLVVQVHAIGNGIKAVTLRKGSHQLKKLIFAMKAAMRIVTHILRPIHLRRMHDLQGNGIRLCKSDGIPELAASQAGRIRDDSQHVILKNLMSRPGKKCGINPTGVGD